MIFFCSSHRPTSLRKQKKGGEEGRKEGRMGGRKEGRKGGREGWRTGGRMKNKTRKNITKRQRCADDCHNQSEMRRIGRKRRPTVGSVALQQQQRQNCHPRSSTATTTTLATTMATIMATTLIIAHDGLSNEGPSPFNNVNSKTANPKSIFNSNNSCNYNGNNTFD